MTFVLREERAMNSETEQNIDKIIDRFIDGSDTKTGDIDINQLIEIKKLVLEEQKNTGDYELKKEETRLKDRQSRFPASILNNPTTTAVIAALAGFITTSVVTYLQGRSNRELEELKFQSTLIVEATKSDDLQKRIASLRFYINAGLIKDSSIIAKLEDLIDKGNIPQSSPIPTGGVSVVPSARKQLIDKDSSLKNSTLLLVGLKVKHGQLIDSITPMFAEINPNLQIKKTIEGQRIGGSGGEETLLERKGYIVTGINLYYGEYFGREEVIHIELLWSKLTPQGINTRDQQVSEKLGSGEYSTPSKVRELRAKPGYYISDLRSNVSSHTDGGVFLNNVDIQQEKLPLNN